MSISNENNRPSANLALRVNNTAVMPAFRPGKKVCIHSANLVLAQEAAASSTNYQEVKLQLLAANGTLSDVGNELSNETAALAVGATSFGLAEGYELEADQALVVTNTKNGNAQLSALVAIDYEVVGN